MAAVGEEAFRQVLSEALAAFKNLRRATVSQVLDEYAPKLSMLASAETVEERDAMYEAIMTNAKVDAGIAGIRAETAIAAAVVAALRTAAGFARLAVA